MRITIDLDTDLVITGPGVPQQNDNLSFKRADVASLEVQFARGGQIIELDDGMTGVFELKTTNQYDAEPVTGAGSWSKIGAGNATFYLFQFTLITTALDALFKVDGDPLNDIASVKLMGEVMWSILGISKRTQTLTVTVLNNVIRVGDTIPGGGAAPDYIVDDQDPDNPQFIFDEAGVVVVKE